MKLIKRNYRITLEQDKKVKKLAKKYKTKLHPSGSESEFVRRAIEEFNPKE